MPEPFAPNRRRFIQGALVGTVGGSSAPLEKAVRNTADIALDLAPLFEEIHEGESGLFFFLFSENGLDINSWRDLKAIAEDAAIDNAYVYDQLSSLAGIIRQDVSPTLTLGDLSDLKALKIVSTSANYSRDNLVKWAGLAQEFFRSAFGATDNQTIHELQLRLSRESVGFVKSLIAQANQLSAKGTERHVSVFEDIHGVLEACGDKLKGAEISVKITELLKSTENICAESRRLKQELDAAKPKPSPSERAKEDYARLKQILETNTDRTSTAESASNMAGDLGQLNIREQPQAALPGIISEWNNLQSLVEVALRNYPTERGTLLLANLAEAFKAAAKGESVIIASADNLDRIEAPEPDKTVLIASPATGQLAKT